MRITDLNTLVTASLSDILYIVDVSDTGDFISGSSKQITVGNFFSSSNVGGGGTGGSGYLILTSSYLSSSVNLQSETFTSNGIQTSYTLSTNISESDDIFVFINGVAQLPVTNYSVTGSTLNLNGVVTSGSKIEVRKATSELSVTFITGSMGVEYFVGNGLTSSYTRTSSQTVNNNYDVLVSIDGLIQKPTIDYTISGSSLNFTTPPPNNTDIEVRYLNPQTFTLISGGSGGSGAGFPYSGSAVITGSLLVTNYISGSLTGSLKGTSSYSNNSLSSSYSLTSSYALNSSATGFPFSGSAVITGSLLVTNGISGSLTGSLLGTSSYSNNTLSSSYSNNSLSSSYARTASYALSSGGGTGAGFPFSGSAVITGSLSVTQIITLNNTLISASGNTLYLNGSPISVLQFAYFSSSVSSSSEVGILHVRNQLLQGRTLLNGNIYISNLSSGSSMTMNVYNSNTNALFQTETLSALQNGIYELSDFIPLTISGSGYFTFKITSSLV